MPTSTASDTNTMTSTSGQQQQQQQPPPATSASTGSRLAQKRNSTQSSLSSGGDGDSLSLLSSNAADYDHIRNTTLMFFLDRLFIASKDGKEARTLHDLSCLFGTKDFTKEMRQIVGASRNGLRKFLLSYPSLFTIEGDKVYLTQLRPELATPTRDYNKEAVEYFTQKLNQFGASLVPIKNLFGYRSQASQEVRHVSGKNSREFKQFLRCHEDVFEILADEHVILKSALRELESRGETQITSMVQQSVLQQESGENQGAVMDPYLNKRFAHLIEASLKKMLESLPNESSKDEQEHDARRKVTLEYLHERILKEWENPLFLKMVKTIDDLKVFLRMHPKIFKRLTCDEPPEGTDDNKAATTTREYVTLLTDEERKELELQTYPSSSINSHPHASISRQHSTLERSNTISSNLSDSSYQQPQSLQPQILASTMQTSQQNASQSSNGVQQSSSKATRANGNQHEGESEPKIRGLTPDSNQNNSSSALRANAPPFVPSSQPKSLQATPSLAKVSYRQQPQASPRGVLAIQRSNSSLTNPSHVSATGARDPRQALRAHLMKASVENSSNGLYSPNKQSNGAQYNNATSQVSQKPQPIVQQQQQLPQQHQATSGGVGDDLRARTVNIVCEASNVITRIMTTTDAVAFDCKGYNLGFNGQITLIQLGFLPQPIGSPSLGAKESPARESNNNNNDGDNDTKQILKPEICIFDLITNPELAYCLKPLLESDTIIKIVHDVRNKSNALFVQFGIMLNHVFDTQVANLVIQQQETGKPAYKSRYISMGKLCEVYGDEALLRHRNKIKSKTRHLGGNSSTTTSSASSRMKDVNYWRTRPLSDAMVYESTLDVYCLVGGIYQNLKSKIKPEYQPLFEQLNLEGVLARIKPDEIRSVKKERKIDLEVIELKRKLYSDNISSVVLSNREIRLLRHIDLTDEVRQKIQHCKKVAKKLERLDMKAAQAAAGGPANSQASSDTENQSIGDLHKGNNLSLVSNGDSHSSGSTSMGSSSLDHSEHQRLQGGLNSLPNFTSASQVAPTSVGDPSASHDEHQDIGLSNLMDGSMFDELKDRMIESSSLLESLEDDDDDGHEGHPLGGSHHNHQHGGHIHSNGDCCKCQCHRNSTATSTSDADKDNNPSSLLSAKSNQSSTTDRSDGSRAVDMAIQCDLLN